MRRFVCLTKRVPASPCIGFFPIEFPGRVTTAVFLTPPSLIFLPAVFLPLIFLSVIFLCPHSVNAAPTSRPNVLLIVSEDNGPELG